MQKLTITLLYQYNSSKDNDRKNQLQIPRIKQTTSANFF